MILQNFAVIEGGDGSGTSTQLTLLENNLKNTSKFEFFTTGEPTNGPLGLLIRHILTGELSVQKETLARLFAADRCEHLYAPGGIIERCTKGELVISDRYTPSSLVYQGLECGREIPQALNASFPHPELLIYLDIDGYSAMKRISKRSEKAEIYDHAEFQDRVRNVYLELLPEYQKAGVRIVHLDGQKPPEEIAADILSEVQKMPIMKKALIQ